MPLFNKWYLAETAAQSCAAVSFIKKQESNE